MSTHSPQLEPWLTMKSTIVQTYQISSLVCSWKIDIWTAGRSFDFHREDSDNDVCPKQLTKFLLSKDVAWHTFVPQSSQKTSFDTPSFPEHSHGHSLQSWGNGNRGMTHSLFSEFWRNGKGNREFERTLRLRAIFFGIASESERQFASKNHDFFRCSSLHKMSVFWSENHDELRPHPFPPFTIVTSNFSHCVSRSQWTTRSVYA